jgi:DNA-binding SARP family transcriptional activator
MALEIELLGTVRLRGWSGGGDHLEASDRVVLVGSAHARVALALLTLERGRGVSRDLLADTLWPGGLPPTWASALRSIMSRVRSHLAAALGGDGDGVLTARGGTYVLRLPDATVVDVERAADQVAAGQRALARGDPGQARSLATAATLSLRAPFLPDHDSEWTTDQRERLGELLVSGLEVVGQAAIAVGEPAEAIAAGKAAVAASPLRESAHRCLMAAHAAAGNRAEALRVYEALRRLLADELGVDPDLETEAAHLALLGPMPDAGAAHPLPSGLAPNRRVPFVGREADLATIADAWSNALQGTAPLVVVTGEAGVGKTRLAMEVAQRVAGDGTRVVLGQCDESRRTPYQPFVELLDPLLATASPDDLGTLSPAARAELAAVFPALAAIDTAPPAHDQLVLFEAVSRLVGDAAIDHPLLVVMDNLQWADDDTVDLLRHVVRHNLGRRLLVLAMARTGLRPPGPVSRLIRAARSDGRLVRVQLHGLDEVAVRRLIQEVLPDRDELTGAVPQLVDDSSGNPFVLLEELQTLARTPGPAPPPPTTGSDELDDFVTLRLESLGPAAHTLLVGAAVLGRHFDLATVAAVAGLDSDAAVDALEQARAAGLVVEADPAAPGEQYRFAHDLLRRHLYGGLNPSRRRQWHSRIADALEDREAPIEASVVARHRCAAAEPGGDVRAVGWALAAAREAATDGAMSSAVEWCSRALDHVTLGDASLEAEVLAELGLARLRRDDPEGVPILVDATVRARRSGRVDVAAQGALGLADVARDRPELLDDARALIEEVLATEVPAARPPDAPRLQQRLWAQLIARQAELGDSAPRTVDTRVTTAVAVLRRELTAVHGPDHLDVRARLASDLRVTANLRPDSEALVVADHHRAMVAASVGDDDTLQDALGPLRAVTPAAEAGPLDGSGFVEQLMAEREVVEATTEGRFDAVTVIPVDGWPPSELGPPAPGVMSARQLVVADWLLGRGGSNLPEPDPRLADSGLLGAEAALVWLARGERGHAHIAARELVNEGVGDRGSDTWLHAVGMVSLAVVELGDSRLATDLGDLLAPWAALTCGVGYRSFVGTASFHLGRLAAVAERWADAEAHLTTALRQLAGMRARPWIALTQHALAEALEARGRSSDRDWVMALRTEATQLTRELGLRPPGPLAGAQHRNR